MSKTYKFEKRIAQTDIEDILQAALHGTDYWSDDWELKENTECLLPINELLTNGFSIKIHDNEEDKSHTLTLKKFLKGLGMMEKHDYYEYDKYDADQVIQYALFGRQVYS